MATTFGQADQTLQLKVFLNLLWVLNLAKYVGWAVAINTTYIIGWVGHNLFWLDLKKKLNWDIWTFFNSITPILAIIANTGALEVLSLITNITQIVLKQQIKKDICLKS